MRADAGSARRSPAWWNHQRHVLVGLRRAIETLLRDSIHLKPGEHVVDLGCGERPYEPLFLDRGALYIACDLEGDGVVPLVPGKLTPLKDGSADGVASFQVLEHVWDLDWYLKEAHRLLKPGGWLLLSTHGAWLYHPHPTDYRRWTRDGLVKELETRGFEVQAVSAVVGPLAWTTQFRLLGIREALLKVPLLGRGASFLVAIVMNLRMAVEDRMTPAAIREVNASLYVTLSRKPLSS